MPSVEEEKQIVFKELKVAPRGCGRACSDQDVERLQEHISSRGAGPKVLESRPRSLVSEWPTSGRACSPLLVVTRTPSAL